MSARRGVKFGSLAMLLIAAQPANALEWELVTNDYSNARVEVPDQKPVQDANSINAASNEGAANTLTSDREISVDDKDTDFLEGLSLEGIAPERAIHIDNLKNTPNSINRKSSSSARRVNTAGNSLSTDNSTKTGITEYNLKKLGGQLPTTERTRHWELVTDNADVASAHEPQSILGEGIAWEYVPIGQEIKIEAIMAETKFNEIQTEQIEPTTQANVNRGHENWVSKLLWRNKSMATRGTSYRESKITNSSLVNSDTSSVINNINSRKNIVEEPYISRDSADIVLGLEQKELWNASEYIFKIEESKAVVPQNMQLGVNELKATRIGSSFQFLRIRF